MGIYKITNPKGKVYIGESKDIAKRMKQYAGGWLDKQWKLQRSIIKYGWENHSFEVLEECSLEQLRSRERFWQLTFNSIQEGLNLKLTGSDEMKTSDSDEVKANRSKGQQGRKHTEETLKKLSKAKKGVAKPEGFGAKIRERFKGVPLSAEHAAKIGKSHQRACLVDGVRYDSCKQAAEALRIPPGTLYNRMHSEKYKNCCYIS